MDRIQEDRKQQDEEKPHVLEDTSPIEQVALTVPTTDDPTLPVMTFRVWVLGILCCGILSFVNQFFNYRDFPLSVGQVTAQIAVVPVAHFMAKTLPTRKWRLPFTSWEFTLNPGPFNIKEHVLITIFSTAGAGGVYAAGIVTITKAFYRRPIDPLAAFLLMLTTQVMGFGWAGLFRKMLVDSAYMWWPSNLVQVSLFRALNEKETRKKGSVTRLQFFLIVLLCSFAYYIIPNFFFGLISTVSVLCYIWPRSVTMQQIGSGVNGLGLGSFGVDWATVASYLGTPLATPWYAIANVLAGFALIFYVITPAFYWTNVFDAKKFPIFTSKLYASDGNRYNTTGILGNGFTFNNAAYEKYGKVHLSTFFAMTYGVGFAALSATIVHVAVYHGRDIWDQTRSALSDMHKDIHTRIMKKNYKTVPQWWFVLLLVLTLALSFWACEGFNNQLQLPFWGIFLACAIAFFFTLPVGIIQATTNQQPGLNIITEYIIGYLYQGHPLANVCFKTYGYIAMIQALSFTSDFKLGHYMKIPPRSMFAAQLVSTVIAAAVYFGTCWWMLTSVANICDSSITGNIWTCPNDAVFYSASIIWGVVGPKRMFGRLGLYKQVNWFFLIGVGAVLLVWLLQRLRPRWNWLRKVNIPILIGATGNSPPARSVDFIMWGTAGFIFNFIIFRRYKKWWSRHNYVLSAAMDAGVVFLGILCYFALQSRNIDNIDWWGGPAADDKCDLATCPTAPGVVVDGCPVF